MGHLLRNCRLPIADLRLKDEDPARDAPNQARSDHEERVDYSAGGGRRNWKGEPAVAWTVGVRTSVRTSAEDASKPSRRFSTKRMDGTTRRKLALSLLATVRASCDTCGRTWGAALA